MDWNGGEEKKKDGKSPGKLTMAAWVTKQNRCIHILKVTTFILLLALEK